MDSTKKARGSTGASNRAAVGVPEGASRCQVPVKREAATNGGGRTKKARGSTRAPSRPAVGVPGGASGCQVPVKREASGDDGEASGRDASNGGAVKDHEVDEDVDFAFINTRAGALAAIATGIDVNAFNDEGYAPLHLARNEEVARALVDAGADASLHVHHGTYDEDVDEELTGSTPLHLARDTGVVRVLVKAGADIAAEDCHEYTPLHRARNAGVVDALIAAGADVAAETRREVTPLHRARTAGVVYALTAAGADTDAEDSEFQTPLECAKSVKVARALLDGGADIEHWRVQRNCFGEDPLEHGSPLLNSERNEDISLLLIECGANVNASYVDESGGDVSAVWKHVKADNVRVVREMLRKNAVVDSGDLEEAARKSSDEMLRLLIGSVGVSVTNKAGSTVLHSALHHTKLLLDFGADVHARDKWGNTPLHTNIGGEVARLFIEKGADIEAVNHEGETPLHYVCEAVSQPEEYIGRYQRWEKLKVLLKAGASRQAKRKDGKTPPDLLHIVPDRLLNLLLQIAPDRLMSLLW